MLGRRGLLSALLCLPAFAALAADPVPPVGPPLGSVALRVPEPKFMAFMTDLSDFADTYQMHVVGEPSGLVLNGRPVLVIWYTRPDGITLLVTDAAQHERLQAFFYMASGGTGQADLQNVMQGYLNKMSGYPRFAE